MQALASPPFVRAGEERVDPPRDVFPSIAFADLIG
jgi:hypothetical protein